MNIFELFFLAVFFYAVFFILGGLGKILGINPLFLGIPAIVVGIGLIDKSKESWVMAVIVGISFGIGQYLVGRLGTPPGIAAIAAMAAGETLLAVFVFCLLLFLVSLFLKYFGHGDRQDE